jgi:hypothetical protein
MEKPARKTVGSRHTYIETHVETKGAIKKDRTKIKVTTLLKEP